MVIKVAYLWSLITADSLALEANGYATKYKALYVFGDSLSDVGNNKYFIDSSAKVNFLPYGIDFRGGPTGRFSNGKILIDFIGIDLIILIYFPFSYTYINRSSYFFDSLFIASCDICFISFTNVVNNKITCMHAAEMAGLPLFPSYADVIAKGDSILFGVNYASAGAGILRDTGYFFVLSLHHYMLIFLLSKHLDNKLLGHCIL